MRAQWLTHAGAALAVAAALASSSCASDFTRQSHSPTQLVITQLLSARSTSSTTPTSFSSGPLTSDIPGPGETYFNDFGQATVRAQLRDLGAPGSPAAPTQINDVTVTRYRVVYRRADGRNTPGVDVPHPFDGAVTVTIPGGSTGVVVFELVRHNAKVEPPLAALGSNPQVLTTIAEVTFFGTDQAGNEVSATGTVQINFGSFAG